MRKVSERTIKLQIGLMRSVANNGTTRFPFLEDCANNMEKMLKELLELRKNNALRNQTKTL